MRKKLLPFELAYSLLVKIIPIIVWKKKNIYIYKIIINRRKYTKIHEI